MTEPAAAEVEEFNYESLDYVLDEEVQVAPGVTDFYTDDPGKMNSIINSANNGDRIEVFAYHADSNMREHLLSNEHGLMGMRAEYMRDEIHAYHGSVLDMLAHYSPHEMGTPDAVQIRIHKEE